MRSDFICISITIVVSSVFSQRPFARNFENLKRAVPHHFYNDKENADGGLDKIARGHKIEPRQPPLRPHQAVPWLRWVHEGRWAAQADKNSELHKVRARLLEEKLKPNQFVFKPHINPQLKPKLKQKENARTKREVLKPEVQKETEIKGNVRRKRDLMMPQLVPEMIMQPHIEAKMAQPVDQSPPKELNFHFYNPNIYYPEALEALANQSSPFKGRVKDSEKREKRQILYFINRPPQYLARSPRTTPNPFIRDTHIDEYDIIRPEVGEREGMIPTVESRSSDLASDPLVTFQKVLSDLTKKLTNLGRLITGRRQDDNLHSAMAQNQQREKRSPRMSQLKRKQKIERKKRKKKKQKELSPRQLKHIRRKKEKKERRKMLHDKKLKEKRRLRHKKLGTGPYNKTIIDYYGVYFDPPSSQLNESLYDSIYDTSEIDSDALYEEKMKERYDDDPESESEDSEAYYDEQIYGDTKESSDINLQDLQREVEREVESLMRSGENKKTGKNQIPKSNKASTKLHQDLTLVTPKNKKNNAAGKDPNKKKE